VVEEARRLDRVTFEEMLEMASRLEGSADPLGRIRRQIPVKTRVLSSLTDPLIALDEEMRSGTLITFEEDETMEKASFPASRSSATKQALR
jgi:aspartate kinase